MRQRLRLVLHPPIVWRDKILRLEQVCKATEVAMLQAQEHGTDLDSQSQGLEAKAREAAEDAEDEGFERRQAAADGDDSGTQIRL